MIQRPVRPYQALPAWQVRSQTLSLAVALLAYGAIEWASKEKEEPLSRRSQPWIRLGGAAALLALGFFGEGLNVGWLVTFVVGILLIQVSLDVIHRLQRPEPEAAREVSPNPNGVS